MNVARHRLLSGCLSRPEHVRLDGDSAVNFKSADVKTGEITDEIVSLLAFKKKLDGLGHFHTGYADIEHLKRQFREQLDVLIR